MKLLKKGEKTEFINLFMKEFINTFLQKKGFMTQKQFVSYLYSSLLKHEPTKQIIEKYAISESLFNHFIILYFQKLKTGLCEGNIYKVPHFGYYTIKFYKNSSDKNTVRRARIRRFALRNGRLIFIYGKTFIMPNYNTYQKIMYAVYKNKNGVYCLPQKQTK
jgi:hypothetical protein